LGSAAALRIYPKIIPEGFLWLVGGGEAAPNQPQILILFPYSELTLIQLSGLDYYFNRVTR
jgi:hypothetical protein